MSTPNRTPNISELAEMADLTDESSMFDTLQLIMQRDLPANIALYLSCVDMDDPSQMYDALVHLGAQPLEWAE